MTSPSAPPPDLDAERLIAQLRKRCEALERRRTHYEDELARKASESEAFLRRLLTGLLDVDDVLAESLRWSSRQNSGELRQEASALVSLTEQVSAAHRLLRRQLLAADVRPMDLVHQRAEPGVARVVGTRPTSRHPADLVLEERVPGFYLGQQVLRTSEVVIAVPGADTDLDNDPEESRKPAEAIKQLGRPAAARKQPRRLPRHRRRTRRRS